MSYASNTCVSELQRCMGRRGHANVLVSQCSRKRILQKLSSNTRCGWVTLGCHAGRTRTLAPAPSERARPGKTRAGTVPCGALRVRLACGLSCRPAKAHRPHSREVTLRQKCALFFLIRRSGSPGSAPSICRGLLHTSTTDTQALRASAGWRAKARVERKRRDEMGTTLRWTSAELEVWHNDDKRY